MDVNAAVTRLRRTLHQDDYWHGERSVSEHFRPGELAGYPNDLRAKTRPYAGPTHEIGVPLAHYPPPVGPRLHPVTVCQVALGWHERWLHDREAASLNRFFALADWLVENQKPWAHGGVWPIDVTMRSYGRIQAPWVSALVQGQALSVLARAAWLNPARGRHARTAMEAAFAAFEHDTASGGVRCEDEFGVAYEEYPSARPSIVLNGLISALWGLWDLSLVEGDGPARRAFHAGVKALLDRLPRYDLGFWSRYCLYPYPIPEVASPYYHREHLAQLEVMARLVPDERWERTRARFARYQANAAMRGLALVAKAASRVSRTYASVGRLRFSVQHEYEA